MACAVFGPSGLFSSEVFVLSFLGPLCAVGDEFSIGGKALEETGVFCVRLGHFGCAAGSEDADVVPGITI